MKTPVDTSTVQTILTTQSTAFSQEPIRDTNTPWGLFVGGGLLVGGLLLAIAATNYTKRQRRLVPQSLGRTHKIGTSDRHSRPHNNSDKGSSGSSDSSSSSSSSYDSSPSSWSSDSSSSSSYDSSPSSWSSDSSSSSSYDSSPSSSDCGSGSSGGGGAGSDW